MLPARHPQLNRPAPSPTSAPSSVAATTARRPANSSAKPRHRPPRRRRSAGQTGRDRAARHRSQTASGAAQQGSKRSPPASAVSPNSPPKGSPTARSPKPSSSRPEPSRATSPTCSTSSTSRHAPAYRPPWHPPPKQSASNSRGPGRRATRTIRPSSASTTPTRWPSTSAMVGSTRWMSTRSTCSGFASPCRGRTPVCCRARAFTCRRSTWDGKVRSSSGATGRHLSRRPDLRPCVLSTERAQGAALRPSVLSVPQVQEGYYSRLSPEVEAQFSLVGWGWHHEAGVQVGTPGAIRGLQDVPGPAGHKWPLERDAPFFLAVGSTT